MTRTLRRSLVKLYQIRSKSIQFIVEFATLLHHIFEDETKQTLTRKADLRRWISESEAGAF
jgi:hypothetical protein